MIVLIFRSFVPTDRTRGVTYSELSSWPGSSEGTLSRRGLFGVGVLADGDESLRPGPDGGGNSLRTTANLFSKVRWYLSFASAVLGGICGHATCFPCRAMIRSTQA